MTDAVIIRNGRNVPVVVQGSATRGAPGPKGDPGEPGDATLRIEDFGGVADSAPSGPTGTNNASAIAALKTSQASENRNASTFYKGGREVKFADDAYYFGSTIPIKVTARYRGMGVGQSGGEPTLLRFATDIGGLTVERANTLNGAEESPMTTGGDGTLMDGLLVQGNHTADSEYQAGIRLRARGTFQNSIARSFPGAGVLIAADTSVAASSPVHGNANSSVVSNVKVQNNLDGVAISGGDANCALVQSVDASDNRRWGFYDASFLANTLVACHTDANGFYNTVTNTTSIVSHNGFRWFVKAGQDALAGTTEPGTNAAVWGNMGGGGVNVPLIPAWELNGGASSVEYRAGGAYYINPVGATTVLVGCYYETGQPPPQVINGIVLGGFMGKGMIEGGPHLYASVSGGLTQQRPFTQTWTYLDDKVVTNRFGGNLAEGTDAVDLFAWSSSEATPSNPNSPSMFQHSRNTGDLMWNSNSVRTPLRLTGPSTVRNYGRTGTQGVDFDNRFITEIDQLALGSGADAGNGARIVVFGSAAPTTGAHAKGEIVLNDGSVTATDQVFAWKCKTAGTPGTWTKVSGRPIEVLTQAAYDALGTPDANTLYFVS